MMRPLLALTLLTALVAALPATAAQAPFDPEAIVRLETAALDRWGKGDPDGYLEIMAPDVTYFDPLVDRRLDGIDALKAYIAPLRGALHIDRSEMLNPTVVREGSTAILTFNLISHGGRIGNGPKSDTHWNSTEIYRLIAGRWLIVHSHWSYTKPAVKPGA